MAFLPRTRRALIAGLTVGMCLIFAPVGAEEEASSDCGAAAPDREPDAQPYADNQLWAAGDGVHYAAPGGATPRRGVSASPSSGIGVTIEQADAAGLEARAGDESCVEPSADVQPPRPDESGCGKPTGDPVTVRPNNTAQSDYEWNAGYQEVGVTMTSSRTCATLAGVLYGPLDFEGAKTASPGGHPSDNGKGHPPRGHAKGHAKGESELRGLPAVLVLPPSGGVATGENVAYVARALARAGYVTLTVDPQGVGGSDVVAFPPCGTTSGYSHPSPCDGVPFQRMDNWMEAGRTGLDFLLGPANPWAEHIDNERVGATGHSLGARAASYLQDPAYDLGDPSASPRVHAVVGLDNLSANYYGDRSASSGNGALNEDNELGLTNRVVNGQPLGGEESIRITAPGLGLGSDDTRTSPDDKKEAALAHRAGGQAAGMLIFDGVEHGEFSQTVDSDEADLFRFAHYTVAWFDLWLDGPGHDTAVDRLLARSVDGTDVSTFLSDTERSGFWIPGLLDGCEDWRAGC